MTTDEILDLLDESKANASKKFKLDLLTTNDSELLRQVCLAAYDPYTTYGMNKLPKRVDNGDNGTQFNEQTWALLGSLANRELTGSAAITAVINEMALLTLKSSQLFGRIIKKDLRAGFSESTINKAFKKLIPTFPYMRCSLVKDAKFDKWDWESGVFVQEKADGMFANVNNESTGIVMVTSRQGSEFPLDNLAGLVSDMQNHMSKDMQYHGEIVVERKGVVLEREIGNGIMNSVMSGGTFDKDDKPVYLMWDAIPLSEVQPKGKYAMPYKNRLSGIVKDLKAGLPESVSLIETRVVHSLEEAYEHYETYLQAGKEGVVIKPQHATWKDGTSREQIKLKLEVDVDLKVIGIMPGKVGTKVEGRAGALTCVTSCGGLVVDVTVKNEAMRDDVDANPHDWLDSIIVVRSNQITKPSKSNKKYSLFLPRLVEANYRTDKHEPDSLQQVQDQFEAAIKGTV